MEMELFGGSYPKRDSSPEDNYLLNVLGLNQDRADVIIPACEIYMSVMKWAGIKNMYVPSVGMVDGIIQTLIDKNLSGVH